MKSVLVLKLLTFQASATCTITDARPEFDLVRGKRCSNNIKIDGALASKNNFYPAIQVEYKWQICNYHTGEYKIQLTSRRSEFRLWATKDDNLYNEHFDSINILSPGQCIARTLTRMLDTKISHHNMEARLFGNAIVSGRVCEKGNGKPCCNAYDYEPIVVNYGSCNVEVS